MSEVVETIGVPAALEGLAEECCELAQAALKLARIMRDENPTPVSYSEANENLKEEYTDVIFMAIALELRPDVDQIKYKGNRFKERIENAR